MEKPKILSELSAFLACGNHTLAQLCRVAGVALPIPWRVLTGKRKDMTSRNADALRAAMKKIQEQEGGEQK